MQVWQQLPEVSESEAYRHLSDCILPWMTEKVNKKEKDKNRLSKSWLSTLLFQIPLRVSVRRGLVAG